MDRFVLPVSSQPCREPIGGVEQPSIAGFGGEQDQLTDGNVESKSFRLADEVRYIQRRAADYDGRIEGPAFVYTDQATGRVATILGYPTDKLSQIG